MKFEDNPDHNFIECRNFDQIGEENLFFGSKSWINVYKIRKAMQRNAKNDWRMDQPHPSCMRKYGFHNGFSKIWRVFEFSEEFIG